MFLIGSLVLLVQFALTMFANPTETVVVKIVQLNFFHKISKKIGSRQTESQILTANCQPPTILNLSRQTTSRQRQKFDGNGHRFVVAKDFNLNRIADLLFIEKAIKVI